MKNKKTLLILIGVAIALILFYVAYNQVTRYLNDQPVVAIANETVTNDELSLAFSYPSGEQGFSLVEPPVPEGGNLKKAYLLMPTTEYIALQNNPEQGETPAAISVFVFDMGEEAPVASGTERADRITRLQNWAQANANITSINLAQNPPEVVELDSVKALHYKADGLYQQDVYLASYRNNVYMFVGQYNADTDLTYTTFQSFVPSISFN